LSTAGAKTLVVTTAINGELGTERRRELASRLAALIAGELGPDARAGSGIVSARAALGSARGLRVIAVSAEIDRARLSAAADVLVPPARFWERFAESGPRIAAHAFASRALDSELRSYLPRVPLVISKTHKASLDEPAVALACGDFDSDGSTELAVIGRQRARIGRIVSGAFQPSKAVPWSELSALAPTPLREPIALASVRSDGALLLGTTDRAHGVALDADLRVLARYEGVVPWGEGGCARRSGLGLSPERLPCAGPGRARPSEDLVDAVAAGSTLGKTGARLPVLAARRQRDGSVELRIGERQIHLPDAVGAQLALGDLDGDGHVELLTTDPSADPARDAVRVRTLSDDGRARPVLRVEVPSGVHALAICPPGQNGFSPIALATGNGLWILE
jgi:hypothetical protein